MIISHIIGGLGNQMFQYAVGRALSLERRVPLYLDTQDFSGYTLHNGFELDCIFNIKAQLATDREIKDILGWRANSPIRQQLLFKKQLRKLRGSKMFVDTQFSSWNQISEVPDAAYLMGNWQTEKYFYKAQDAIRLDFTFKQPITECNAELIDLINGSVSVSLHIRRGDIASNPISLAFHGLCSLGYYQKALEYVTDRVANPTFFIFSDDIPWARENLRLKHSCYYVENNKGIESYNDMRLMSLCQHHIIANSSFSWWGAWLNSNPNKIVVAPKVWAVADFDTSDIVPDAWIKL